MDWIDAIRQAPNKVARRDANVATPDNWIHFFLQFKTGFNSGQEFFKTDNNYLMYTWS
ncbi:hypothetical protein [Nostoc sp. FACHB-190]|uniref:hypothetical protein n=1 Tax=Nostoc sp. FACHB-190 TaxID=2692838 RepID=UPI001686071F|nr:hypothetical protein [Nostoc sp. FACHB-190]MBD2300494.1 hypothetical protein [Nostoc sp. FACHB-190]